MIRKREAKNQAKVSPMEAKDSNQKLQTLGNIGQLISGQAPNGMLVKGTTRKESMDNQNRLKHLGQDLKNVCAMEVNRRISGCFKRQDSHEILDPVSPIED